MEKSPFTFFVWDFSKRSRLGLPKKYLAFLPKKRIVPTMHLFATNLSGLAARAEKGTVSQDGAGGGAKVKIRPGLMAAEWVRPRREGLASRPSSDFPLPFYDFTFGCSKSCGRIFASTEGILLLNFPSFRPPGSDSPFTIVFLSEYDLSAITPNSRRRNQDAH